MYTTIAFLEPCIYIASPVIKTGIMRMSGQALIIVAYVFSVGTYVASPSISPPSTHIDLIGRPLRQFGIDSKA